MAHTIHHTPVTRTSISKVAKELLQQARDEGYGPSDVQYFPVEREFQTPFKPAVGALVEDAPAGDEKPVGDEGDAQATTQDSGDADKSSEEDAKTKADEDAEAQAKADEEAKAETEAKGTAARGGRSKATTSKKEQE